MIVVNLFGGPGSGKSTGASYVFSKLKLAGVNCELVTEFAKDLVWDGRLGELHDQLFVLAHQRRRLNRLDGLVDVAVTDSPLLLSAVYGHELEHMRPDFAMEAFDPLVARVAREHASFNYLVRRVKPYSPVGRREDESAARRMDARIKDVLERWVPGEYAEVDGAADGYDFIVGDVLCRLACQEATAS